VRDGRPYRSDNGNAILDCAFGAIADRAHSTANCALSTAWSTPHLRRSRRRRAVHAEAGVRELVKE